MQPILRVISLVSALALIVTSAWALFWIFFYDTGFSVWLAVGAGILLAVGLHWLWADFIKADPRPETDDGPRGEKRPGDAIMPQQSPP